MTVNLPFPQYLYFPNTLSVFFSIIGSVSNFSVPSSNGLLVVYARSSLLDFDLVRLDFSPDFLKLLLLLKYLSIFSESTLAGVSVYNQASILDAQSKELHDRTDRKMTNKNIAHFPLVRDYCAKRLWY